MSITVPVTLTIAPINSTFFDYAPGRLSFSMLTSAINVTPQSLEIRNGGTGTLNWTATSETADGGGWLTVSPLNGSTPATITASINPQNLPGAGAVAGTFVGQILFQTPGSSVTVPISVTVGTNVFRQINPITFTMPFGGANPLAQILPVATTGESSGSNFTFDSTAVTSKGGAWLTVANTGNGCCTTPESVTVSVTANTLPAGTYVGEITFNQYVSHDNSITVPVTLIIEPTSAQYFDSMPGQLTFSLLTGSTTATSQTLQVRNGGTGTFSWTAAVSTSDANNWLSLSSASGSTPATITVMIAPENLPGAGAISGTFVGQILFLTTGSSVTVPITVKVGSNVFRQVNPIAFTMPFGGANPLPQVLSIATTGTALTFDASVVTSKGGSWLTIANTGTGCCTTPESITVSVNATTLPAGTYTGEIIFTQYVSHDTAMVVPVTLTVAAATGRYFDSLPGELAFSIVTGATTVTSQSLQIRNGGTGTFSWTSTATTSDGGAWLTATPSSGSTPANVTVAISPLNLPGQGQIAGTYVGQLAFQTTGSSVTIPVTVTVGSTVFRQLNPLSFTMPFGGANPLPQKLFIASTGETTGSNLTFDAVAYTSKGGSWLTIVNTGTGCCTTPEVLSVSVNATTLPAGTYTGEIVLKQYVSHDTAMTIPVSLTVAQTSTPFFDNVQGEVSFSFEPSQNDPTPQTIQILNGGTGTLNWTAATTTSDGGKWLSVSKASGVGPASITVKVNTLNLPGQGLIAGNYQGQVSLQSKGGNVTVPVTVSVGDPEFVQLPAVTFTTTAGISPTPQMITVSSTSTAITFDAAANSGKGGSWLSISPSGNGCCTTSKVITVSVNGTNLTAGTYVGQATFTQYVSHDRIMTVPVIVTVTP